MGNTGKGVAIFLILGLVVFYFYYTDSNVNKFANTGVTSVTRTFAGGETIQFFDPPKIDVSAEIDSLNQLAIDNFGQPFLDLPFELKLQMIKIMENQLQNKINGDNTQLVSQDAIVYDTPPPEGNQTSVNGTQVTPTENNIGGVVSVSYTGLSENVSTQSSDSTIVKRGEIARILGKITKASSPPYDYGVFISCCDGDVLTSSNNLQTDGQGIFEYNFATNAKRPLGEYTVELTTIGDDNRTLLKWYYYFRLVE